MLTEKFDGATFMIATDVLVEEIALASKASAFSYFSVYRLLKSVRCIAERTTLWLSVSS